LVAVTGREAPCMMIAICGSEAPIDTTFAGCGEP